jgi:predicted amidohydrolase YtcJ
MSSLLLRRAELGGVVVDVRVQDAVVTGIGPPDSLAGACVELPCHGGALLPGLHDHHLHLMAMAAAHGSIDVAHDLDATIRAADSLDRSGAWVRAVGYDEFESGPLHRWRLDQLVPEVPIRVQHRSGSMWVLNSIGLDRVGAATSDEKGLERDADGELTGRLFRLDEWLHDRLPSPRPPDLAAVGHRLASFGVTGVTDCTPTTSLAHLEVLAQAVGDGRLPMTVAVTGAPALSESAPPGHLRLGPVKIVIADHALPELGDLEGWIRRAHQADRPVAVHCVTRAALLLALAAWEAVGTLPGDRVEHASVAPPDVFATLADRGIAVVTQPAFIAARGDEYLQSVEPDDQGDLYRCASLLEAGIKVGGSSDAPFGPDDPWIAISAAMDRRSASGIRVGHDRDLSSAYALDLFLAPLEDPGGKPCRIEVGSQADFCLLGIPMSECLGDPSSRHVAATVFGGSITYRH